LPPENAILDAIAASLSESLSILPCVGRLMVLGDRPTFRGTSRSFLRGRQRGWLLYLIWFIVEYRVSEGQAEWNRTMPILVKPEVENMLDGQKRGSAGSKLVQRNALGLI
jgi:hypothetical protein